jgi:hypothetical protein
LRKLNTLELENSGELFRQESPSVVPQAENSAELSCRREKPSAAPQDNGVEFDWGDDSVVLTEQQETAIYFNPAGSLVIRQRGDWPQNDEDQIVIVTRSNIDQFLDKLTDACGIGGVGR